MFTNTFNASVEVYHGPDKPSWENWAKMERGADRDENMQAKLENEGGKYDLSGKNSSNEANEKQAGIDVSEVKKQKEKQLAEKMMAGNQKANEIHNLGSAEMAGNQQAMANIFDNGPYPPSLEALTGGTDNPNYLAEGNNGSMNA